jgi:integrase
MAGKPRKYPSVTKRKLQRSEGPYWTLRWTQEGKRQERPAELRGRVGYLSEEEAEEARLHQEAMLRLGLQPQSPGRARPLDVVEVLVLYIEQVVRRHGGSDYARSQERWVARLCSHFGGVSTPRADRLNTGDLEDLAHALKREAGTKAGSNMSRATIDGILRVIPRAYRAARKAGRIDCDPPELPRLSKLLPDDARPARNLTEEELRRLVQAAEVRYGPDFADFLEFAAWAPRRPTAILSLRVSDCARLADVNLSRAEQRVFFRVDKAGVGRGYGPVSEPARRAALRQYERRKAHGAGNDAPLWTSETGGPLLRGRAWNRLHRLCQDCDLPGVTLYDLRRHGVGQLFRVTYNLRSIAAHTGHRSTQTLLRYLADAGLGGDELAPMIDWHRPALKVVVDGDA